MEKAVEYVMTRILQPFIYEIRKLRSLFHKKLRGMRTRAKRKFVASDRARRENVPGHILFM